MHRESQGSDYGTRIRTALSLDPFYSSGSSSITLVYPVTLKFRPGDRGQRDCCDARCRSSTSGRVRE